jgi:4-hydroxy-tetrahydrodipicolinate synthase
MYLAWKQGQITRAQRLAAVAAPLTAALSRESNPGPVKYALSVMNIVSPRVRLPLVELTNPTMAEIDGILAQLSALYSDYLIGSASPQEREARGERPHLRRTGV